MAGKRLTCLIMAVAAGGMLAGCDTTRSLQQLRHAPMKGSAFQRALAEEYRRFAESELAAYDWWSSKYFADKGMMAAYGTSVPPEKPSDWSVGASQRDDLLAARSRLLAKLSPEYVQAQPEAAAKMQAAYDCWIEQTDEGDTEGMTTCQRRMEQLMGTQSYVQAQESSAIGGPLSTSYSLLFDWDSSAIEGMARDELKELAQGLMAQHGGYQVVINGHADRSGDDNYNMELSQERADEVLHFLTQQGIAASHISYYAFGESDPKVVTADGQRNHENRRVEIFIE